MDDRQHPARKPAALAGIFLQKLREHAPHSPWLIGFAMLIISGGILLLLSGLTLTATVLGLILFAPLIIISSPIWIPLSILFFVAVIGLVWLFGISVASTAALSWMYRYFKSGPDRVDAPLRYPKDYTRDQYGVYFPTKVKDAAPGA